MNNVARKMAEHKTWVLTPMLGVIEKHFASFQEFPVRQIGLSGEFGKTIEKIQNQILSIQKNH
jgi:arylsulfatase